MEIEEVTGEPRTEVTRVNITQGATSANPMRAKRIPDAIAVELDAPERISLFCIASGANAAGNTASVRSRLIVRGLIERAGSQFAITDLGQAVLTAWSSGETNREASAANPTRGTTWPHKPMPWRSAAAFNPNDAHQVPPSDPRSGDHGKRCVALACSERPDRARPS
jgi:hypothetical protein